jgi:hypothetical protein
MVMALGIFISVVFDIRFNILLLVLAFLLAGLEKPTKGERVGGAIDRFRAIGSGDDGLPTFKEPPFTIERVTRILASIFIIAVIMFSSTLGPKYYLLLIPLVLDFGISWKYDYSLFFPVLKKIGLKRTN